MRLHRSSKQKEAELEKKFDKLRTDYNKEITDIKASYSKQFSAIISEMAALKEGGKR